MVRPFAHTRLPPASSKARSPSTTRVTAGGDAELLGKGLPGADVAPAEAHRQGPDPAAALHHRDVDGLRGSPAVGALQDVLGEAATAARGEGAAYGLEGAVDLGRAGLELAEDGAGGPDEDSGVPEVRALAEVATGASGVGLLDEAPGAVETRMGRAGRRTLLDVAEAGVGPGGLHAEGHQDARAAGGPGGLANRRGKGPGVRDAVIRGQHRHGGIGILGGDALGGEPHRHGGVAPHRLDQHPARGKPGVLAERRGVLAATDDPQVLAGEAARAVQGGLEQGAALDHPQEGLRVLLPRGGPEAFAGAPGEDHGVDGGVGAGH